MVFISNDISSTSKDMVFIFMSTFFIPQETFSISNDMSSPYNDMFFIFKDSSLIS